VKAKNWPGRLSCFCRSLVLLLVLCTTEQFTPGETPPGGGARIACVAIPFGTLFGDGAR
jgi:hypothetical protein